MQDASMKMYGLTPTERMRDMGVTSMWVDGPAWVATFASHPRVSFTLPPPVAEWLLAETATVTITLPDDLDPMWEIPA